MRDGNAERLFLPLAEYRENGPAKIIQIDLKTFGKYRSIASVNDHVGALIFSPQLSRFHLFDWSTGVYEVPFLKLNFQKEQPLGQAKQAVDSEWEYQDCKNLDGEYSLCSAKSGMIFVEGEIHLVRAVGSRLEVEHRVPVAHIHGSGRPGGMRPLSFNAMDFSLLYSETEPSTPIGLRFYFVPHDDEDSHLMVFDAIPSIPTLAKH